MKQISFAALALFLSLSPSLSAQTAQQFELENGLDVIAFPEAGSGMAGAVLICPIPPHAGAAELADATLINRLIWGGGSALGVNLREHEYRMLALRFGGSISSQLLPDALVIQYTMPAELLPNVFKYLTVQWNGLMMNEERLQSLKRETAARQRAGLTSSVLRQLLPQVEKRLWSDLAYRLGSHGSDQDLASADAERILATLGRMRDPSHWTLVVSGNVDAEILKESLEQSLGTIAAPDRTEEAATDVTTPPQLGLKLQYPAELSRNYAILAFRLPGASATNPEALMLLAETWLRSRNLATLRQDLSTEESAAELNVGMELRRNAGMLYLSASWNADIDREEVLDRLRQIVETGAGTESEAFAAARKSLLLRYWNRRESAALYAQWIAQRISIGIAEDRHAETIAALQVDDLDSIANSLFTKENGISLVTVPK